MSVDEHISTFRTWLTANGGYFHPDASFKADSSGSRIVANEHIASGVEVAKCPFGLVVTPEVARTALGEVLGGSAVDVLKDLSERQLMCSYLCLHYAFDESVLPQSLRHLPYLRTLPKTEQLLTPLHFNSVELDAFRGTNLYGATIDRLQAWKEEWQRCVGIVASCRQDICNDLTWTRYLTVSTYISSRAFPSSLLSQSPSLISTPASFPVLIPGVDALNHARAYPVSWVVSHTSPASQELAISLVIRTPTPAGAELFNNYGPKPNSELILAYGFSLPRNPDDTIVLSVGGGTQSSESIKKKWEVGRNAKGVEGLWDQVVDAISQAGLCDGDSDASEDDVKWFEDQLDAAGMLLQMCQTSLGRLPAVIVDDAQGMRPEVRLMLEHYLEGQRDILESIIRFAQEKEEDAVELAEQKGIQLDFD